MTYNFKLVVEWKMDGGIPKWTKEDQLEVIGVIQLRSDDSLDEGGSSREREKWL